MKHLKTYRAIRLIHRTGSIRKAATQLAISPSALNRSIQAFEDELSFSVFDRLPGGVRLSEAGELLIDVIDRHLVEFGELQAQLGNLRDGEAGGLRISMGGDIASGVALDCVSEVEDRFPGLSVEILSDDTIDNLLARRVHLALLTNPATEDATEVLYSWECPIAVCQTGDSETPPKGIWDLAHHRVTLPGIGTGTRTAISHVLRRNRLTLDKVTATSAARLSHHMQKPGAVSAFPSIAIDQQLYNHLPIDLGTVQVCAIRLAHMPVIRPVQAYLTSLQRRLEQR